MCGRYFLNTLPEQMADYFHLPKFPVYQANYNVAPTHAMPVVRNHDQQPEVAILHWGLVPFWAKDKKLGGKLINARSETLAEKPSFRNAWRAGRRCLIPMSGFYEWHPGMTPKQAFAIVPTDAPCLTLAGLWESWTSPEKEVLETYTIITTVANSIMGAIHDRMPVILDRGEHAQWLSGSTAEAATLMVPCPAARLRVYPVSRRVNSVRNNTPDLIEAQASS